MFIRKPAYYDRFRCIAGRCPDSCCKEWEVDVDAPAAARYRALPGPLGDRLRHVLRTEDGCTYMTIENGRCPMWRNDGLCQIQAALGEEALCQVCRDYPRLRHDYGDFQELGLELSCPEAAKFILSGKDWQLTEVQTSGSGDADYDTQAMDSLLSSREVAFTLLDSTRDPGQALTLLLLWGYQAQSALDGGPLPDFDPEAALSTAAQYAKPGKPDAFLAFFKELEILTPRWEAMLSAPQPRSLGSTDLALARYLVTRYWLQAVSDYDLACRVKFTVIACLLCAQLGGDTLSTAQLFSKEIENDADNVDAILDGAYTTPAFADDVLLGMLGRM